MDKLIKMKVKLLVTAALILAITLLSACSVAGANLGAIGDTHHHHPGYDRQSHHHRIRCDRQSHHHRTRCDQQSHHPSPLTACHATGDPANPYEVITVTYDISPVPANGCPASPVLISDGKITICHATGSQTNPYNEITVSVIGLNGHGTHEGDVFPASDGGCPTTPAAIGNNSLPFTVCHATGDPANPYEELTVNSAELNVHRGHPNDIIPAPVNGCPGKPSVNQRWQDHDLPCHWQPNQSL